VHIVWVYGDFSPILYYISFVTLLFGTFCSYDSHLYVTHTALWFWLIVLWSWPSTVFFNCESLCKTCEGALPSKGTAAVISVTTPSLKNYKCLKKNVFVPKRGEVITDITYYITWCLSPNTFLVHRKLGRGGAVHVTLMGKTKSVDTFCGICPIWETRRCEHSIVIHFSGRS
jgi:hypothetical protein